MPAELKVLPPLYTLTCHNSGTLSLKVTGSEMQEDQQNLGLQGTVWPRSAPGSQLLQLLHIEVGPAQNVEAQSGQSPLGKG